MTDIESLCHSAWECKYHIVWIPKYRRKVLFGSIRKDLGETFRELARQRECMVWEWHLCPDHVHIYISIPPKYAVAQVVGYIKGKSVIYIARTLEDERATLSVKAFGRADRGNPYFYLKMNHKIPNREI